MAERLRRYVVVSTTEYAKLRGIKTTTASRKAASIPGAQKINGRWQIPVLQTETTGKGLKRRKPGQSFTARPSALTQKRTGTYSTAGWWFTLTRQGFRTAQPSLATIQRRISHANEKQRIAIRQLRDIPSNLNAPKWIGDDDISILYYH